MPLVSPKRNDNVRRHPAPRTVCRRLIDDRPHVSADERAAFQRHSADVLTALANGPRDRTYQRLLSARRGRADE